ncbi:glycosyltransferase [Candidatus Daviesbacteria bacterium]|nr:glycosyltransferase [Candidatus Daviesbacteria bacterium]
MKNFKKMRVVIATHEATTGPAHDVRDFLKDKVAELLFIAHPLLFIPANYKRSSYYEKYLPGKPVKRSQARHWQGPEVMLYVKDLIYTIFWTIRNGGADIFIGSGNLSAFAGVILKKLRVVDKVVFYCIDYVPERFANPHVNRLYHWVDRLACAGADITWNLSPRMADGRNSRWERSLGRQVTLPIGVHFNRIHRLPLDQIHHAEIVYLGTLLEKQGVQLVIGALTKIASQIPNLHFLVIGSGPYEEQLKELTKQKGVEALVTFAGYVEDHQQVEEMMARGAVAVALYNKEVDQFSYYADPSKVKNYLAAGLPVIITDVPYIAQEIVQKKAGIIVEYQEEQMVDAILGLLKDPRELAKYRQNAVNFARDFDWDVLLTKAFAELVKN